MPLLTVALALAALALGVLPLGVPLRLVGLVALAAGGWWRAARLGATPAARLALLGLLPLLLVWALWRQPQPGPGDPVRLLQGEAGRPVLLRGTLLADPRPRGSDGGCSVTLALAGGRSELLLPSCPPLRQGWLVEARGQLRRPATGPHPLLSGPAQRLARQGVWSQLRVDPPPDGLRVLARPPAPVADLRRRMADALLQRGGPDRGGVLAALVLGSAVVPVPAAVRDAFRISGLSHALAASGFHLTVLLGAVLALARPLPRPARVALAAGAMLLFLLLAGPQPSVVRAVLMGGAAFAVLESGARSRPLGVLLLSVLVMLLVQPVWLLDVGFQLSVAATAGLLFTARDLEAALAQRLPRWAAAGLAVPLAASLWTLPLQWLHFGTVPLYAVPANLVVAPLLTPLTLGAMAMALAAVLLPPLLPLLAWPLQPLTDLLLGATRLFAALPMAQWAVGRPPPALVLLFALALLPWLLPRRVLPAPRPAWPAWSARRLGAAALALCLALHLSLLGGDRLLLVHQWGGTLLLARHRGRGALISSGADGLSCARAGQLAVGLGLQRYDWIALLDPLAAAEPDCWRALASLVLFPSEGGAALRPGQRLASPGLALAPLSDDSRAFELQVGPHRWLLLPDPQSLDAWRQRTAPGLGPPAEPPAGIWLGFPPRPRQRRAVEAAAAGRLWVSGAWPAAPPGWAASGASGSLHGPAG